MDSVLEKMDKESDTLHLHTRKPSVTPEMLLKAIYYILYGIRT